MSDYDIRSDGEKIADAIESLARAVHALGNNNAGTNMGAIENLAKELRDGLAAIAESIEEHG